MDSIKVIRFFAFVLSINLISYSLEAHAASLKNFNTHHSKTIKTDYGHVYDCVDIYKQPAFRNPLLKGHKIQIRASFSKEKEDCDEGCYSSSKKVELGLKEECPAGTVPIRRSSKKERLQSNQFLRTRLQRLDDDNGGDEEAQWRFAGIYSKESEFRYVEAGGYVSTHNPLAITGQLSAAIVAMEDVKDDSNFAFIHVGWIAYPDQFNGDNRTHLFATWSSQQINGSGQGCMNTQCPGFVQVHPQIPIDTLIQPPTHQAEKAYISVGIVRDHVYPKKDWWVVYGQGEDLSKYERIGYYPDVLFSESDISDGFATLFWGGYVESNTIRLPMMGNGEIGELGTHFRQLWSKRTDDDAATEYPPSNDGGLLGVEQSACYKVGGNSFKGEDYWGYSFWFGGAGGEVRNCPDE